MSWPRNLTDADLELALDNPSHGTEVMAALRAELDRRFQRISAEMHAHRAPEPPGSQAASDATAGLIAALEIAAAALYRAGAEASLDAVLDAWHRATGEPRPEDDDEGEDPFGPELPPVIEYEKLSGELIPAYGEC